MRSGFDGSTAWASDPMQGPRLVSGAEAGASVAALQRDLEAARTTGSRHQPDRAVVR